MKDWYYYSDGDQFSDGLFGMYCHHSYTKSEVTSLLDNSRHHPDLGEQSALTNALEVRLAERGRSQQSSAHLVRWSLIACNCDRSFGEQHAGEVVHATIVPHTAHHALRIAGIGGIGVGNGAPLDVFFAGLSVVLSVPWTLKDFIIVEVLTLCLDRRLAV